MARKRNSPPKRRVDIVDPSYQPSQEELEETFAIPEMTLEEAFRRVLAPVEVRYIPHPRKSKNTQD